MALFPSMRGSYTARKIRDAVLEGDLLVEGLDVKEMARYVAIGYQPHEIGALRLGRVIPVRRYRKGVKPGVTGKEAMKKESGDEVRWVFPVPSEEFTDLERRKLFAACLEIGVRKSFALHTYQFGGVLYKQTEGGPIGMRLTMAGSRVEMAFWGREVKKILIKEDFKVWLDAGYVDDMRYATSLLSRGKRWMDGKKRFEYREQWEKEDAEREESDKARTTREILRVMNSIYRHINFTSESPEDFPDGKIPTLDTSLWLESNGEIRYDFFEKSMSSGYCQMETAAISYNSKRASLAQEVVRRMMNTSEGVEMERRIEILETFSRKMKRSGYSRDQRKEIVQSGLTGYERKLRNAKREGRELHRDARSTIGLRYRKKILAKTSWYKARQKEEEEDGGEREKSRSGKGREEKPSQSDPVSIMFTPRTPGGELTGRLREEEAKITAVTGDRVKFVERAGMMVKRALCKNNPWAGENCGRDACLLCRGEEKNGDCRKRNVVYQNQCLACLAKGRESVYYGESCRTAFERGLEHARDRVKGREESHMFGHIEEEHREEVEPVKFRMKVVKFHTSAMMRQIHEAVVIKRNSATKNVLNSKMEYNRCILPELSTKMGSKDYYISEEEEEFQVQKVKRGKRKEEERGEHPPAKRKRRCEETTVKKSIEEKKRKPFKTQIQKLFQKVEEKRSKTEKEEGRNMNSDEQVEPEINLSPKVVPGSPEVVKEVPKTRSPEIQIKNTVFSIISDDQTKFAPKLAAIFSMKSAGKSSSGKIVKKKRTKNQLKIMGKGQNKITHHFKIRQEGELTTVELTAGNQDEHEKLGVFAQARSPDKCSNKVGGLESIKRSKRKRNH